MLGFLKEGPGGVYVQAGGCTRATEGVWVGIIRERALGEARGGGGSSRWGARGQCGLEKCSSWALRSALRVCGERLGIYRGSSSSRGDGVARCTPEAFPPGALGLQWGDHCWPLMPSSQPGSLDPNILSLDLAPWEGAGGGRPGEPRRTCTRRPGRWRWSEPGAAGWSGCPGRCCSYRSCGAAPGAGCERRCVGPGG